MDIKKEEEQPITESRLARKRTSAARNSSDRGAKRSSMMNFGETDVKEEILEVDVKVENPDVRNIGSSCEPISYVPISQNVKRIPTEVKNVPLQDVVNKEEPGSTDSTGTLTRPTPPSSRIFIIHGFRTDGNKHPTAHLIYRHLANIGVPLQSYDIVSLPDTPFHVGLKVSPVVGVRFEVKSEKAARAVADFMKTDEYTLILKSFAINKTPMITRNMDLWELVKTSLVLEVARQGHGIQNVEALEHNISSTGFEEFCDRYEVLCRSIYEKMSAKSRFHLGKIAAKFSNSFRFKI